MTTKKKMKIVACCVVLAALLFPLAATAGAQKEEASAAETIEPVSFWIAATTAAPDSMQGPDGKVNQWVRQEFGFEPTVKWARDDAQKEFTLLRTTRNLPDVFTVPDLRVFSEIVRDGFAMNLDKYFEDPVQYPNLALVPKVHLAFTTVDNHIYAVPRFYDRDLNYASAEIGRWLLMRKDLPADVGLSAPSTLKGFTEFLRTVKQKQLKGYSGDKLVFPLGFTDPKKMYMLGDSFYGKDPTEFGMSFHLDSKGRVIPAWATKERYLSLKTINALWREGLIDPETFTQKADVRDPKMADGRYAFMYGSYGDAWAQITVKQEDQSLTREQQDAWFEKYELVAVPIINAEGYPIAAVASHSPYPRGLTVFNSKMSKTAVDKVMKLADWMQTQDGMFTQYFEGYPGAGWKYDETGIARRNAPWSTYTEMMQVYFSEGWHFSYVNLFGYNGLREMLQSGCDYKRDEVWWVWLYGIQKQLYQKPENITKVSAIGQMIPGSIETEYSAKIEDIWAKNWAKCVNAESDAAFEENYNSLIQQLLATDWQKVVQEKKQLWDEFLRMYPAVAAVKNYPTATAISEVDSRL